jgi:shikimate dehydrogenase
MKRLAVLGHPVSHSRSPAMQNAALEDLGLAPEWSYEAIDVAPEDLESRLAGMPGEGFVGANVTVPHKEAALALADSASDAASSIGAANTLVFSESGTFADNTDAPGLIDAIASPVSGRRALVLGAGGAARAAVWALAAEGAEVSIWNRTAPRAAGLASEFRVEAVEHPGGSDFDLIVNASAAGLGDGDGLAQLPLSSEDFRNGQTVVDMVYGSGTNTLLEAADAGGAATVDGLEMLVRQGARSLAIWTGLTPSLAVLRAAARG